MGCGSSKNSTANVVEPSKKPAVAKSNAPTPSPAPKGNEPLPPAQSPVVNPDNFMFRPDNKLAREDIGDICTILNLVQNGSNGEFYRASDSTNIPRLLKLTKLNKFPETDRENFIMSLLQEVRRALRLPPHPFVLQTAFGVDYRHDMTADDVFLVLFEDAEGGFLSDRLREVRSMGVQRVLKMALELAHGLQWLHQHQIVHCDVKPENVVLHKDRCKLLNYGHYQGLWNFSEASIVKSANNFQPATFNPGSPSHWSPEQGLAISPQKINSDPRFKLKPLSPQLTYQSDIYSWALTVVAMLEGSKYWTTTGEQGQEILEKLTKSGSQLPEGVVPILQRCLQFHPSDRYQSMSEVITQLEAVYFKLTNEKFDVGIATHQGISNEVLAIALSNVGATLKDRQRVDDAIEDYLEALKLNPQYVITYVCLGAAYHAQGRFSDAIDVYRRALQIEPDYALCHSNLGLAYLAAGNLEAAIASHRKAIALEPRRAASHRDLGVSLSQNNDRDGAIKEWKESLMLDPIGQEDLEAYVELGWEDKFQLADQHHQYAMELRQINRLEEASQRFKKTLFLDPLKYEALETQVNFSIEDRQLYAAILKDLALWLSQSEENRSRTQRLLKKAFMFDPIGQADLEGSLSFDMEEQKQIVETRNLMQQHFTR